MPDSVRVDTDTVRAGGQQAAAAGGTATPGSDQVQPSAADMVSVGASTRFTTQVSLARKYTSMANAQAHKFGVKLQASAAAYDDQEAQSASTLGSGGGGAKIVSAGRAIPAAPAVPTDVVPGVGTGGLPAGEVPKSPRDVARLIETGRGGAGKKTWQAVEASLRSEAKQLDDAAEQLGKAISTTGGGWHAKSADAATTQMRALQSWYQGHSRYVQGLADQAHAHVQNFTKALTDVPPYRHVQNAERELKAAKQANARSGGAHRVAVVNAQVKVSKLYQASTTGYSTYTFSEAVPEPKLPVPPPVPPSTDVPPAAPPKTVGDGPVAPPQQPQHSPKSAPQDPVQGGPGVGENLTGGPTWPPGAVDPAGPAAPLTDAVPETAAGMPSEVVPGIIGGVVGGLGGLVGGLAAAPQKALQGLEQAAGPMMSAMGQHPQGGQPPEHGGDQSPPEPPAGDAPSPGDLGAGGGGDTEPAGGDMSPVAPPTDVAAAPPAAAPATAPASTPAPAEAPAPTAVGAMGPMMPPGGGRGGEGGGPENKQLYQERKLKVVAPANSEPVKNRREGRPKPPPDRKT